MIVSKLSTAMLIQVLIEYCKAFDSDEMKRHPLVVAVKHNDPNSWRFVTSATSLSEMLERLQYCAKAGQKGAPTIDEFAFKRANEKIEKAYLKYRDEVIKRGATDAFQSAYFNFIAMQVQSSFEDEIHEKYFSEDEIVAILDQALHDEFLHDILDYASQAAEFRMSNLYEIGCEIESYCISVMEGKKEAGEWN